MKWMEEMARRWLSSRGYVTIRQPFVGIVFGYCTADQVDEDESHRILRVIVPKAGRMIALNHSVVNF